MNDQPRDATVGDESWLRILVRTLVFGLGVGLAYIALGLLFSSDYPIAGAVLLLPALTLTAIAFRHGPRGWPRKAIVIVAGTLLSIPELLLLLLIAFGIDGAT